MSTSSPRALRRRRSSLCAPGGAAAQDGIPPAGELRPAPRVPRVPADAHRRRPEGLRRRRRGRSSTRRTTSASRTSGPSRRAARIQFGPGTSCAARYTPLDYTATRGRAARLHYGDDRLRARRRACVSSIKGALLRAPTSSGTSSSGRTGFLGALVGAKVIDVDIVARRRADNGQRELDTCARPCPSLGLDRPRLRRARQPRGRGLRADARQAAGSCYEFDDVGALPPLRPPGRPGRLPLLLAARREDEPRLRRPPDQRLAVRPRAQPLAGARAAPAAADVAAERVEAEYLDHLRVERGLSPQHARWPTAATSARLRGLRRARAAATLLELRAGRPRRLHRRAARRRAWPRARWRGPCTRCAGSTASRCARAGWTPTPWRTCKAPRAFKALPRFLTAPQVEALLAAPDIDDAAGPARPRDPGGAVRHRPARLRAHRRCGLGDVDLEVGLVTCFGKGRKERLVPLGREARRWVARYLRRGRGPAWRAGAPRPRSS